MLNFITCAYPFVINRLECWICDLDKINKKVGEPFPHFCCYPFKITKKKNNIMETKENLMQSMSEKQNEMVTEKFIADFALIDAKVVQKKSAWDIANENPAYSFVAFF